MTYLGRRYWFSASHRLYRPGWDEERNNRVYGKCNNPGGHGHNYGLEVTVAGVPDPRTGMVMNLADLDRVVAEEVLDRFGHSYLNADAESFGERVPTAENLCKVIFARLDRALSGGSARLARVRLEETSKNSFEYRGEAK